MIQIDGHYFNPDHIIHMSEAGLAGYDDESKRLVIHTVDGRQYILNATLQEARDKINPPYFDAGPN